MRKKVSLVSNVKRVIMLKEKYEEFMLGISPAFQVHVYQNDKSTATIMKNSGAWIWFWQPKYTGELVYSSEAPKE